MTWDRKISDQFKAHISRRWLVGTYLGISTGQLAAHWNDYHFKTSAQTFASLELAVRTIIYGSIGVFVFLCFLLPLRIFQERKRMARERVSN